jgi:hypothetical protein
MMRFIRRWMDKQAAREHHEKYHVHQEYGRGRWVEREPGCPWCDENRQWWLNLRANQAEDRRKHRAKLAKNKEAYERHTQ